MEQYYFLFALAGIWTLFATIQDVKTTEISNWLNFSLIAFALAYRGFYSIFIGNFNFLFYGIGGVVLFWALGSLFYYGRIFAGGDAKLLFGLGAVLPFESLFDYVSLGIGFILLLFVVGAVYSLVYTLFAVSKNPKGFKKEFIKEFKLYRKYRNLFYLLIILLIIFIFMFGEFNRLFALSFILILLWPLLYFYAKAVEKSCMVKFVSPGNLMEGDWLIKDVKVNGKTIKKTVHGLNKKEIALLRRAKKKIWIKGGIPFSPVFFITLILFGLWYFSI